MLVYMYSDHHTVCPYYYKHYGAHLNFDVREILTWQNDQEFLIVD